MEITLEVSWKDSIEPCVHNKVEKTVHTQGYKIKLMELEIYIKNISVFIKSIC